MISLIIISDFFIVRTVVMFRDTNSLAPEGCVKSSFRVGGALHSWQATAIVAFEHVQICLSRTIFSQRILLSKY